MVLSLTPQEQVEFYFDLEEDYPNEYYQQRYNEQQEDEKNEITVPEHLTDKEKANLWRARTHNKINKEAGTITLPKRRVEKIKPRNRDG
jgi:hypothetical protein